MSVLISGSLAYDTIFTHQDPFAESIRPDALKCLNLTFSAQTMEREFGGCAGNIAYSLKSLGGDPLIWTAVGSDSQPFFDDLNAKNISTDGIHVFNECFSAQAVITTDPLGNQLTTFYSGAMEHADRLTFPENHDVELAILAPTTRSPLVTQAKMLIERGVPYMLDTGQTTPLFSGAELQMLVRNACAVAFSDYEALMYHDKTGWTPEQMSKFGIPIYLTHGKDGSTVWENGKSTFVNTPGSNPLHPVGAGDAYRGGLLWAMTHGLTPVEGARLGSLMGAVKVGVKGPTYKYTIDDARRQYEELWGKAPF